MESEIAALFLNYSIGVLDEMTGCIRACLGKLTAEQIWQRHAEHENAVGNLILHLSGNMRQWIIHGVGGELDIRERDKEFSATGGLTAAQLLHLFQETVGQASAVLKALPHERLTETITPQGREVTVLGAIYHVVGHVQQHTGQIILLTKQMLQRDLDLTIPRPR